MAYIPDIIDLKPFYIQANSDSVAHDTTEWGLIPRVNPYPLLPTPKEPFKNEWYDEHGDDEYNSAMYYESMEISVGFYVKTFDTESKTSEEQIREQIDSFFAYIRSGEFMIYDSYTGLGRKKVRYAGYSEESFKRRCNGDKKWSSARFTINFKINDPITRVVLDNGTLKEE
ncbi:MAG: hypothetical protein J6U51_05645 [Bacteroidales bacterium]|nr:hypothetical protein [Bacteroidales bacterium]